jgi:ribA/ribD-fused uncharacterized protein
MVGLVEIGKQISLGGNVKMEAIMEMRGPTKWLSNYEETEVVFEGMIFNSTEAAFQAAKTLDLDERKKFTKMSPSEAKKAGQTVKLRSDWESVKEDVMYQVVMDKYLRNVFLKEKLLATGEVHIEEGNHHGDRIWGTVDGVGLNLLGKITMRIRTELRNK